MSRFPLLATAAVALLLTHAMPARSETYFGFQVGIRNAPPAPVVTFVEAPHYVVVPGTRVYAVDNYDYDLFRYGSYTYFYNDGYWYRARSYRGPFAVIDVRQVPQTVIHVPVRHWKNHPHGGPPGQLKKMGH